MAAPREPREPRETAGSLAHRASALLLDGFEAADAAGRLTLEAAGPHVRWFQDGCAATAATLGDELTLKHARAVFCLHAPRLPPPGQHRCQAQRLAERVRTLLEI
jgi:hypothetical protein